MHENYNKITLVENPQPMDYGEISEQFFGKWVAIYQPNRELAFEEGTVVAYGDCTLDIEDDLWAILKAYRDGVGAVKRFREEDWCEGYVIIRNVR